MEEIGRSTGKELWLLDAAHHYGEVMDAIKSFLPHWLECHSVDISRCLYHYTTLDGFRGIIDNRGFWFGHATSFNDPNELLYGRDLIQDVLNEYIKLENREPLRQCLEAILQNVSVFGTHLYHVFVACFCESPNLLSQWRAYADRGGGYCIGVSVWRDIHFLGRELERGIKPYVVLRKVIYNKLDQIKLIRAYLDSVIPVASTILMGMRTDKLFLAAQAHIIAMDTSNVLLDYMLCFKDCAFADEQEWRLIRCTRDDHDIENVSFRLQHGNLIPYQQLHMVRTHPDGLFFPITSVKFGPSLEPMRTRAALQLYLQRSAITNSSIRVSPLVEIQGAGYKLR